MIIFVHIPKTGGTSIRASAAEHFGEDKMLYDYGPKAPKTSDSIRKFIYESEQPVALAEWVRENGIEFFSGHFNLLKYRSLLPEARAITWVRDPVERIRSVHAHRKLHHDDNRPLWALSKDPAFQDVMSQVAGGDVDAFDMVGILERQEESLALLKETTGVDLADMHMNKGKRRLPIPKHIDSKIRSRNRRDCEFVALAHQVLNSHR